MTGTPLLLLLACIALVPVSQGAPAHPPAHIVDIWLQLGTDIFQMFQEIPCLGQSDGQVIPSEQMCNGVQDCTNGFDEADYFCGRGQDGGVKTPEVQDVANENEEGASPEEEAGTESDTDDAGVQDEGTEDAGSGDAGTEDEGTEDEGTEDVGTEDAGTEDVGSGDEGTESISETPTDEAESELESVATDNDDGTDVDQEGEQEEQTSEEEDDEDGDEDEDEDEDDGDEDDQDVEDENEEEETEGDEEEDNESVAKPVIPGEHYPQHPHGGPPGQMKNNGKPKGKKEEAEGKKMKHLLRELLRDLMSRD